MASVRGSKRARFGCVVVGAMIYTLAFASTARSADGWNYQLIREVPGGDDSRFCSFAINDSNQVAYAWVDEANTRMVELYDGGTSSLVYAPTAAGDPNPVCNPPYFRPLSAPATVGLRNDGLVTFEVDRPAANRALAYARVGAGLLGTIGGFDSSERRGPDMNDAGNIPSLNLSPSTIGFMNTSTGSSENLPTLGGGISVRVPALTSTNQSVAFLTFGSSQDPNLVVFDPNAVPPATLRTANLRVLGLTTPIRVGQPSVNKHGIASGVTFSTAQNGPAQVFAIDINAAAPSLINVFSPPSSGYSSADGYSSINAFNQIAFSADTALIGTALLLGDVAGSPPIPIIDGSSDVISMNGNSYSALTSCTVNPRSNGNSGAVAFACRATRLGQSGSVAVLVLATPEAGLTPPNPVLPIPRPPGSPPRWTFRGCPFSPTMCNAHVGVTYYDPPTTVGYSYATDGAYPNFTSVLIPAPLPGGDKDFVLFVGGRFFLLHAAESFDFTTIAPGGVSSFQIFGIDPAEELDSEDPLAFVTGLTFAEPAGSDEEFTMEPLDVPEPAMTLSISSGIALLALLVRRHSDRASWA